MNDRTNPFPEADSDRHSIWETLVTRDIAAFLAGNWDAVAADFVEEEFAGYTGSSNPDHWRIGFPDLGSYRDSWLRQAGEFQAISLASEDKADFLFRATVLRDIEISGDRAQAHKKFDGRAAAREGPDIVMNWQTVYWLRRKQGHWRITGFLGYLPNPMPQLAGRAMASGIHIPAGATQHTSAGPYSPVLRITGGSLIAISGQGPIDKDGNIRGATLEEQAELTLENCVRQLEFAHASLRDVFKVTAYLADIRDWAAFNEVYRRYLRAPYPVRTVVQAALWGGIKVEIDMLAILR